MVWVYWYIVGGVAAMVATLFVCLEITYSKTQGSPQAPGGRLEEPSEAATPATRIHRHAV